MPPLPTAELLDQAHQLASMRRYPAAENALRAALAQEPDNVAALDLLGFVLYFQERPAEAEAACRRVLELRPDRAYALKGLGLCLAKQGSVDEGITYLERAIEQEPGWFDARWDLIVTLTAARRFDAADAALARARERMADRGHAWDQLAKHVGEARRKDG
jgi:tetratricopeptide (TPR) repeat protein